MRCFSIVFLVAFAAQSCIGDRLENTYLPPKSAQSAGGSSAFLSAPRNPSRIGQASNLGKNYLPPNLAQSSGFGASSFSRGAPSKLQSGYDQSQSYYQGGAQAGYKSSGQEIPILKFNNDNDGNGNYEFSYETANGIKAQEVGKSLGDSQSVQGGFSYTGPDGVQYSVSYVADENGFRPVGDHLPTPPPIPEEILRAIQQNERDEANGIVDDGSYKGDAGIISSAKSSYDNSGYRY